MSRIHWREPCEAKRKYEQLAIELGDALVQDAGGRLRPKLTTRCRRLLEQAHAMRQKWHGLEAGWREQIAKEHEGVS